jgi:hypothetical protein
MVAEGMRGVAERQLRACGANRINCRRIAAPCVIAGEGRPPTTSLLATRNDLGGRPSSAMTQKFAVLPIEALISPRALSKR